jgi:hypothetical protein
MKRSRCTSTPPAQLEFQGLVAETIDICTRLSSGRGKNLVPSARRTSRWQPAESQSYHLSSPALNENWLEEAYCNLKATENIRDGLVMTAGYISDILDLLIEKNDAEDAGSNYSDYCGHIIRCISTSSVEGDQIAAFCWRIAQLILDVYESCHGMNDWDLCERLESVLPTLDTPRQDTEDSLSEIFRGCLCLLHGWITQENWTQSGVLAR